MYSLTRCTTHAKPATSTHPSVEAVTTATLPLKRQVEAAILDDEVVIPESEMSFNKQADGSYLLSGRNPDQATYIIKGKTSVAGINAIRLDVLPDPSLPAKGPGRVAHGNFVLNEVKVTVGPENDPAQAKVIAIAKARTSIGVQRMLSTPAEG